MGFSQTMMIIITVLILVIVITYVTFAACSNPTSSLCVNSVQLLIKIIL